MKLDILVRDLHSGEKSIVTFESLDDAKTWLSQRPKYTDVMGLASHHVPREVEDELRGCLKPLDEEERVLERKIVEKLDAETEEQVKAQLEAAERASRAHRAALADADPNRPMNIHYVHNQDLSVVEPDDERPISEAARQAVIGWVNERKSWVKSRNQIVAEATVQVWPGPVPEGKGNERVIGGSFVPISGGDEDN